MTTLFISHATADDPTVDRIATALTAVGLTVWVDHRKGLVPGDDWSNGIQTALHDCAMGLFVASPRSVKSAYCRAEWNRILALGRPLYVALIELVPLVDYPLRLGTIQYANLADNWDDGLQALIDAIVDKRALDPTSDPLPIRLSGSPPRSYFDIPLLGRETDMQAVLDLLERERVVWVTGLGGVGKTRFALELADSASRFQDGVVWHTIDDISRVDNLLYAVRDHLRLPHTTEPSAIWHELSRRALLMVIDNAEACKTPANYTQWFNRLDSGGGTRVLLTSRYHWRDLKGREHNLTAPDAPTAQAILQAMVERYQPHFTPNGLTPRPCPSRPLSSPLVGICGGMVGALPRPSGLARIADP